MEGNAPSRGHPVEGHTTLKQFKSSKSNAIYELDGRPPFLQAFPLGFQQLLAMFVGNIVPMILVASAANMDSYYSTLLIQCSVLGAGVATLIQAFPIHLGKIRIGSGLPIMPSCPSVWPWRPTKSWDFPFCSVPSWWRPCPRSL